MKFSSSFTATFFVALICNAVTISKVSADVYAYHGVNGERILTDKRIYDKQFKLVKVYKTAKKVVRNKPAPRTYNASLNRPVKPAQRSYGTSLNRPAKPVDRTYQAVEGLSTKAYSKKKSNVFRCGDKRYIQSKQLAYQHTIRTYAKQYGVDEDLIHSVVKQESCFNEKALSRAGAIGLMQLMPGTASYLKVKDPWNPEQNIRGGVKYLSQMLKRFKGNKKFALAAYNAGPGKVIKYGGIPPYKETRHYVKKIMADYSRLKNRKL